MIKDADRRLFDVGALACGAWAASSGVSEWGGRAGGSEKRPRRQEGRVDRKSVAGLGLSGPGFGRGSVKPALFDVAESHRAVPSGSDSRVPQQGSPATLAEVGLTELGFRLFFIRR